MEEQDKVCKGQGSQKTEDPAVPREDSSSVLKNKVLEFNSNTNPYFECCIILSSLFIEGYYALC